MMIGGLITFPHFFEDFRSAVSVGKVRNANTPWNARSRATTDWRRTLLETAPRLLAWALLFYTWMV